jgi:TonB family protein
MTSLPKGVAGEVLDATHCDANWIGFGFAAIDPAGRVHETDFKDVYTSDACKRALNILFRSSLATDLKTPALPAVHDLLLAHHGNAGNCFDEPDVVPHAASEAVRVTREMVAPKKIRSVEPVYPESARLNRDSGIVILESQINTNGCVTAMRILKPLTPELTSAALISLSQWRFTPALSDGKPVDVIYNLTVNFKLK